MATIPTDGKRSVRGSLLAGLPFLSMDALILLLFVNGHFGFVEVSAISRDVYQIGGQKTR